MELLLKRIELADNYTIGRLYVDGAPECWVCEDTVREPGVKVHGKTAIPYGRYEIYITMSARFKRMLPLLIKVPMFEGIRIHPGNTALDTEGCLLPGRVRLPNGVGESRLAFDALYGKLNTVAMRKGAINITIEN